MSPQDTQSNSSLCKHNSTHTGVSDASTAVNSSKHGTSLPLKSKLNEGSESSISTQSADMPSLPDPRDLGHGAMYIPIQSQELLENTGTSEENRNVNMSQLAIVPRRNSGINVAEPLQSPLYEPVYRLEACESSNEYDPTVSNRSDRYTMHTEASEWRAERGSMASTSTYQSCMTESYWEGDFQDEPHEEDPWAESIGIPSIVRQNSVHQKITQELSDRRMAARASQQVKNGTAGQRYENLEKNKRDGSQLGRGSGSRRSRGSRRGPAGRKLMGPPDPFPLSDPEKDFVIGWDSKADPDHPRNYKNSKKWTCLAFVSSIAFLSPLSSSIVAPGITAINRDFNNTNTILSTFVVSIFVLGFAVGPPLLSPLSEIYGRRPVLNVCNVILTVFQMACALAPTLNCLIAFRFLAGLGGSAVLAVGGGIIADLFPIQQRGKAQAIYVMGPLIGPVLGPVLGGFIAQRAGWRWIFWVLLCASFALSCGFFILGRETNHTVLLKRKIAKLAKETGRTDYINAYDAKKSPKALKKKAILLSGIARPFRMMCSSPILPMLALYMSFVFGLVYLIFTTVTEVFIDVYHFSPELSGLAYLGVGVGFFCGMITVAKTSDKTIARLTAANDGVYNPEMRLAPLLFFAWFVPISFFWYGWTVYFKVFWIVPILGLMPFGFGVMGIMAGVQTYFIDSGGMYAASAMAGLTVCRCLFAAFLPLAGPSLYRSLGLGWGNSLLGFVALGLIPVPALIYRYGMRIRTRYPIRLN